MESVIKWRTGEPKEGNCIVTYTYRKRKYIACACWDGELWDYYDNGECRIIAWCPLSEIEPYKE